MGLRDHRYEKGDLQMKSIAVASIALGVFGLSSLTASAEDVVGSWKQTAFYQKVVSSGEKRYPFTESVVGRVIYTKEGTYCNMATASGRKQAGPAPTDEERLALFKSMYAFCGTYKVEGSKISGQPDVAWTPGWITGGARTNTMKLDGKKLTIESTPFKSQLDGVDVVAITEYERE
jgi:hypothetical protein